MCTQRLERPVCDAHEAFDGQGHSALQPSFFFSGCTAGRRPIAPADKQKGIQRRMPFIANRWQAYRLRFSHFWLATVQDVLQADWQEAWHSPQPPCSALFLRFWVFRVLMCFMVHFLPNSLVSLPLL